MRKVAGIAGAVLATGAVAVLSITPAREHRANLDLRQENAALRTRAQQQARQLEQLERLRAENQRLASVKVDLEELERLRKERQELLRLRGEVGVLRKEKAELDRIRAANPVPRSKPGRIPAGASSAPSSTAIVWTSGVPVLTPPMPSSTTGAPGGPTAAAEPQGEAPLDPQVETEYLRRVSAPANSVSWSPGQAAGPPDTHQAGDIRTAWAAQSPDGGAEWLKVEYEQPMDIAQVRVRETHNPGAVVAITAMTQNGAEVTLWQGEEPRAEAPVEVEFNVPGGVIASTITVHLDTKKVPGWNEIDAVELVGRDGSRQWAKGAAASSYYGESRERRALQTPPVAPQNPQ